VTIDYENRQVSAVNVDLSPVPNLTATNVQRGIEQLQAEIDQAVTELTSSNDGITVTLTPINADSGVSATLKLNPATATDIGGVFVAPNNGLFISPAGGLRLLPPTSTDIGGVKAGDNVTIEPDGTINAAGGGGGDAKIEVLDNIASQFNGAQRDFVLRENGASLPSSTTIARLFIFLGGVDQTPGSAFTWNPTTSTITFSEAPVAGTTFDGRAIINLSLPALPSIPVGIADISPQFNGTQITFALTDSQGNSVSPSDAFSILVVLGGVVQPASSAYNIVNNQISFTEAPLTGTSFYAVCYSQG
jgi:hypothetical protein